MEKKKTHKADLQNKRVLFFEIGLLTALGLSIAVFMWGTTDKQQGIDLTGMNIDYTIDVLPPVTNQNQTTVMTKIIPKIDYNVINLIENHESPRIDIGEFPAEFGEIVVPQAKTREKGLDDQTIFIKVEVMPSFMGGDLDTFRKWVLQNVIYPELAVQMNLTGKVIVEFVVEKDGTISGIQVLQTPDKLLSQAAIDVLSRSPEWTPGMQQNRSARVKFVIPIDFRLQN